MRKENEKSAGEHVLETAYSEFLSRGYRRTTLPGIAKLSGAPPAVIKRICFSKKEIFRSIFEREKK
ncbi:hypothetical protein ACFL6G_10135, partial [candidate division KSB1 bacterium]